MGVQQYYLLLVCNRKLKLFTPGGYFGSESPVFSGFLVPGPEAYFLYSRFFVLAMCRTFASVTLVTIRNLHFRSSHFHNHCTTTYLFGVMILVSKLYLMHHLFSCLTFAGVEVFKLFKRLCVRVCSTFLVYMSVV